MKRSLQVGLFPGTFDTLPPMLGAGRFQASLILGESNLKCDKYGF